MKGSGLGRVGVQGVRVGLVRGVVCGLVCGVAMCGCAEGGLDGRVAAALSRGEYGVARAAMQKSLSKDRADRLYILDRMRLQIATLADGQPRAAEEVSNEAFSLLRVQGLNEDKTTASVVLNEGVKTWKGEPFEQAMAFQAIAVQKAMLGEWDNARTAANNSLFLLKDFGENERGEKKSTVEIARKAAAEGDGYLDKGYAAVKTDFALGYVMTGLASLALGREDEARDHFREAARQSAGLEALAGELSAGKYNTVFVVEHGAGPRKEAYGPDGAFARFSARTRSDGRGVRVREGESPVERVFPVVCDVNEMAQSHLWNNMEDVRAAKSALGDMLLQGGVLVAASANQRNNDARQNQQIIGAAMAIAGLFLKATAHADTRHLELLPQRVYVVPVMIGARDTTVTLEVEGEPASRMVLMGVDPPRDERGMQLRYVRLGGGAWASSGRLVYANDEWDGAVEGDGLPYVLGGRCVRSPSAATMARYHRAGNLLEMTSADLESLYREEGIALSVEDARGESRAHVLEGGDSLVCPLAGSAGYARLFGQEHPAYVAKSARCKELSARVRAAVAGRGSKD